MSRLCETVAVRQPFGAAAMRGIALIVMGILSWASSSWTAMGFDERYERDYNIYTPTNRYASDNPLNPVNAYDPTNPFNPIKRYDPSNPANSINQYNPNNPFNPVNRYHPDNPLNPVNKFNPGVPFGPLDGIVRPSR